MVLVLKTNGKFSLKIKFCINHKIPPVFNFQLKILQEKWITIHLHWPIVFFEKNI